MKKLLYILMVIFISVPTLLVALENEKKTQIKDIKYVGNERIGSQTIKFYTKLEPSSYVNNDDIDSILAPILPLFL